MKTPLTIEGLEDKLKVFEALCANEKSELADRNLAFWAVSQQLENVKCAVNSLMFETDRAHRQKEKVRARSLSQKGVPVPYAFRNSTVRGPRYETPKTAQDVQSLLFQTFGASDTPLVFGSELIDKAFALANGLENRSDWAVFCMLLSKHQETMSEAQLCKATGYTPGSVSGSLQRLVERNLVTTSDRTTFQASKSQA